MIKADFFYFPRFKIIIGKVTVQTIDLADKLLDLIDFIHVISLIAARYEVLFQGVD